MKENHGKFISLLAVDTVAPKLQITDNIVGTANGPVLFTFNFSEAVKNFDLSDIKITKGTAGTLTKVSDTQYTLQVTPTENSSGVMTVSVADKSYTDLAGNLGGPMRHSQVFDTHNALSLLIDQPTSVNAVL